MNNNGSGKVNGKSEENKTLLAPRRSKNFKSPAFVPPRRSSLVAEFDKKMSTAIDKVFVDPPVEVQVESDEEPKMNGNSLNDSKRKLDMDDDVHGADQIQQHNNIQENRKKARTTGSVANGAAGRNTPPTIIHPTGSDKSADNGILDTKLYYSVSWAKLSNKKHRVWEEDGILIVNGKQITMKSSDGKVVCSHSNFKFPEVELGVTEFKFGGKIVGIHDVLTASDLEKKDEPVTQTLQGPISLPVRLVSKPFINPGGNLVFTGNKEKGKPMFDPDAPNALVMPIPDKAHQRVYNSEQADIVAVVVDPHVSRYLRAHQRDGVTFMYDSLHRLDFPSGATGVILADEMGLGKTLQTVALLWTMMKQNPYNNGKKEVKKALIVTPSSLVKNWEKEFHRWLGAERIRVFGVDSDHPLKDCPSMYSVVIISYDMCTRSEELLKRMKFDIMICDEAHKLKNKNGQAYQLLIGLACNRRILLTGTPIQNDLSELYCLVNFGIPGALGSDLQFSKEYEKPIMKILDSNSTILDKRVGELKAQQLNDIMSKFFLRRDHSVMTKYLPPRITYVIFCKPTFTQIEIYKRVVRYTEEDSSATLSSIFAMKKICNQPTLMHPKNNNNCEGWYNDLGFPPHHRPENFPVHESGKLKVLVGMLQSLQEAQEKVVLVSHYTKMLDILEEVCKAFGFPFVRLDGSTQSKTRQGIVDKFNSDYGESFIFLLSSKAGGMGLNLHGASRIILYDIDWNPAHDMQAMARCWRPGQKKTTHIYRLITTGTIEERIYMRQVKKQDLSGSVMDLLTNNPNSFSPAELKDIFSIDYGGKCLTHELMECGCKGDGTNRENLDDSANKPDDNRLAWSKKKANPIGELQKWEHFIPPFEGKSLDPALMKSAADITMVFRNKSDESQAKSEEEVLFSE